MKYTIICTALGLAAGTVTGTWLGKRIAASGLRKWRERMESKQIDTEIRLDLLEYNHLHQDGDLRVSYGK